MRRAHARFVLLLLSALVLGLVAEDAGYGYSDPNRWLPDLVTGWVLAACGLLAWRQRPSSPSGVLVAVSGFTWFAGNFAHAGLGPIDAIAAHALYLHRGPLIHVTQTHPGRAARGRVDQGMIAVGYVASILTPAWASPGGTIVIGGSLIIVTLRRHLLMRSAARHVHTAALRLSLVFGGVLVAGAILRHVSHGADETALLFYELALCVFAVDMLVSLVGRQEHHRAVSDLVVELGEARSGTLRDALAHAVHDPTLVIGYRLPDSDTYVDDSWRPIELPGADAERRVTPLLDERDGPEVVVVHDSAALEDPAFAEAFAAATRLTAQNAHLQAALRMRLEELAASRKRLIGAEDAARRSLERELRDGAQRRLRDVSELIRRALVLTHATGQRTTTESLVEAQMRTADAVTELQALASGLHPRALQERGLKGALDELVGRSGLTVRVATPERRLPAQIETVVYFVCAEALANVMKYAPSAAVSLQVDVTDARVLAGIADDGPGGADPSRGSGLRGLLDRVESVGGSLKIESVPGGGTRLICEIPVDRDDERARRP